MAKSLTSTAMKAATFNMTDKVSWYWAPSGVRLKGQERSADPSPPEHSVTLTWQDYPCH